MSKPIHAGAAALAMVWFLGCGKRAEAPAGEPGPRAAADDAAPEPATRFQPLTRRVLADLCADPALAERARAALAGRSLCERDTPASAVEIAAGDRTILVVSSPGLTIGSAGAPSPHVAPVDDLRPRIDVLVDEQDAVEPAGLGGSRFWESVGPFPDLGPDQAQALLEAVLLTFGDGWVVTSAERATLESAWPRARSLLADAPPGLGAGDAYRLRAWRTHEVRRPGVDCRYLTRREVAVSLDGTVSVGDAASWAEAAVGHADRVPVEEPRSWAEGNEHGEPCGPALPEPDPAAARCPGQTEAPESAAGEVGRLLRVIAAHASASGGCYDGPGGQQVRLAEHASWIHDRSASGFAVSVRYRLTRTRLCGDTRGQPACTETSHDIPGCLRVEFERAGDDGYRLLVPERLSGLETLMTTPLDRTHDGSCAGKSGAFRPKAIQVP